MAVPNLWRTKRQRYRLQADLCPVCSESVLPPREICPHCHQPMRQPDGLGQPEAPALVLTAEASSPTLTWAPVGAD